MHKWMQCLYTAIKHLWKACEVIDGANWQAGIRQHFGCASSRDQVYTEGGQLLGKRQQTGFIGNT